MVDYIERAQEALKTHRFRSTQVPDLIMSILKDGSWKNRNPSPGKLDAREFEYFPEFVEAPTPWGLQVDFKEVEDMCRGFIKVELALANAKSKEGVEITDDKFKKIRKTGRQLSLLQLKEFKPELYKKVEKNELSVHQAMIDAGLKKKVATLQKSPEGFAKYIQDNFTPKQREAIIKMLKSK